MNNFARILQPADKYIPDLLSGKYGMNWPSQRVIDSSSGQFVAALVPGEGLQQKLAGLPWQPSEAAAQLAASAELSSIAPVLQSMQLVSTVGALASVANLGVSCVGFALVLRRLDRIDGKLDEALGKLDVLQVSVERLQKRADALAIARLRSAGESLDRALAASSEAKRLELAAHARHLFQESRAYYLELWRNAQPWGEPEVPVVTAIEMQNRFVACSIGEIQAEFIGGDMGTFRHAVRSAVRDYREHILFDAQDAFRSRSDGACRTGQGALANFAYRLPALTAELRLARQLATWTATRLEGFEADADLPAALEVEPHEVVQAVRSATGDRLYVLRRNDAA